MGWKSIILAGQIVCSAALRAQVPSASAAVLQQMASHAAVIFTGQVTEVDREDAAGFVDVRFRIDQALRGCPKSGTYVVREWSGLWTGQPERYRVGQRRLMLLRARGSAGMSAPVGGMDGAIPLVAAATEPLANSAGVAPADDGTGASASAVDLRWIQARAVRDLVAGSNVVQEHVVAASGGPDVPHEGGWSGAIAPLASSAPVPSPRPASLSSVFAVLGTSAGARDARY